MLDVLKQKLVTYEGDEDAQINYMREILQLIVLKLLEEKGHYKNVAFLGGTALRIIYDVRRFSEDLDFSLTIKEGYDFNKIINDIDTYFKLYNLPADIKAKDRGAIGSAYIRFTHVLYELGLSPHKDQKFTIKFDIDQNPPRGAKTSQTIINKDFLVGITHHDLPSLFAGKLHAILHRSYTKGRDFYDLIWFLSKKIDPNYILLNNAIHQTEKINPNLNKTKLFKLLEERIEGTNMDHIKDDVRPFLTDKNELTLFTKENFLRLIKS